MPSLSPRYDEGSGGSGDEGRDEAHKREWNLFYQKQMSLRKVKGVEPLWGPLSTPFAGADLGAILQRAGCLTSLSCHLPGQRPQDRRICTPRSVWVLWAASRVWMEDASLGVWGLQRVEGRVESLPPPPR